MPKKILLCWDNQYDSQNVISEFRLGGYDPFVILEEKGLADKVIDSIKDKISDNKPDYVVLGNFRGEFESIAEVIKGASPKLKVIIYSANSGIIKKARESGYAAFKRPVSFEKMKEFIEHG